MYLDYLFANSHQVFITSILPRPYNTAPSNFLDPNDALHKLISKGYSLTNAHLRKIAPKIHNIHPIFVTLSFITKYLRL